MFNDGRSGKAKVKWNQECIYEHFDFCSDRACYQNKRLLPRRPEAFFSVPIHRQTLYSTLRLGKMAEFPLLSNGTS